MIKRFVLWFMGETRRPVPMEYGQDFYAVIYCAWAGGFTVSSDLARKESAWVAMASCLGLISTMEPDGSFGRTWYATPRGFEFLKQYWENT